MLKDGILAMKDIARYSGLSLAQVKKLQASTAVATYGTASGVTISATLGGGRRTRRFSIAGTID